MSGSAKSSAIRKQKEWKRSLKVKFSCLIKTAPNAPECYASRSSRIFKIRDAARPSPKGFCAFDMES